jgi:hypothetical protein
MFGSGEEFGGIAALARAADVMGQQILGGTLVESSRTPQDPSSLGLHLVVVSPSRNLEPVHGEFQIR